MILEGLIERLGDVGALQGLDKMKCSGIGTLSKC